MSDIRQTLTDVLSGAKPPEAFLAAVDEYLAKPNANVVALRSLIDAAEKNGLPRATADAARAKLEGDDDLIDIGDPTRAVEEDSDGTVMITGEDAPTHLRADPADIDRTVFTGGGDTDSDATVVTGDNDRTEISAPIDDDKTVATGTGGDDATVQVGGGDDDPFAMTGGAAAKPDEIGPGTVLKGRFRLEQVIGQGGMGAVYKAVDLLKVEARDRNPYIAVKLLVGDFKEHPEAFIALQRESAKAQRLAHPNIATVYDFDRDGETVYMTMELMVGAELAKYIKKLPAGGLPVLEAVKIIEQLCAGLQYAHARGLVHSDFKPGNAFLLDDGSVKLLDFGIARASKTKADAEGESTVFDPGQLGALTPAYATIEMFEGQDPDPRDDIYALAAVSYELFTGKHPFNKMSAVKAKEKGLKPAPVEKLTKRQNKTLFKALALHRDDRTPSVEEFWEGIKPRKDYTLHIAAGATAAALLLGALLYNPVLNILHDREYNAIVEVIESGDVATGLVQIDALPAERRTEAARRAREPLFTYFRERADTHIDESAGEYGYAAALTEIEKLASYFPNDGELESIRRDEYIAPRDNLVSDRAGRLNELVNMSENAPANELARTFLPNPDADDVPELVSVLRAAKPDEPSLVDPRIAAGYAALASAAISRGEWQAADDILKIAAANAPASPQLRDLQPRVADALRQQQEAALVTSLRGTLQQAQPRTIDEFRAVNEDLQRLMALRPDDSVVIGLQQPFERAFGDALSAMTAEGRWADADALLAEFARTLTLATLIEQRMDLTQAQSAAGYTPVVDAQALATRRDSIRALLDGATFDTEFERELTAQFKEYTARIGADTAGWDALRIDVANAHIARAAALSADNLYGRATAVLEQGQRFHAELPAFADARETLTQAETAYRAEQAQLAEAARIEGAINNIRRAARAGEVEAADMFARLQRELPADHPFIAEEGPQLVEGVYTGLVEAAAQNNDFAGAVRLAEGGLRVVPGSQALQASLARNRALAARAAVVNTAGTGVTSATFADFTRSYTAAREALPANERAAFERDTVAALIRRIRALDSADQLNEANNLKTAALRLFSSSQPLASLSVREPPKPSTYAPRITSLINERKLTEAQTLLTEANRAEPGHAELRPVSATLQSRQNEATQLFNQARSNLTANPAVARARLNDALQRWNDNPEFLDFQRQHFQVTTGSRAAADGSKACPASVAGLGSRGVRAHCWDMVAPNEEGPRLVVIPGIGAGAPFALTRTEITVGDFNKFCATGACQALSGDADLPAANISIQQVDAYAAWLTETSGTTYRLPTDAEWRHAANGGGNPGSSAQYWCRATDTRGNVVKGGSPQRVTAGEQNGWGVVNPFGNVQEWVRDGNTLQARGGSYDDSLSDCTIETARTHSGAPDAITGFRLVRGL